MQTSESKTDCKVAFQWQILISTVTALQEITLGIFPFHVKLFPEGFFFPEVPPLILYVNRSQ